jgi:DHA1 family bicyclomycin/chloramphenicol resistance-like MFS transporter
LQTKNPSVIALSTASAASVTGLAFISPIILLIKNHYNISSNEVQLTITIYLGAICISQIIWGPLSDLIGRRIVLIIGASLFSLGGILASLNLAFEVFIFFRFLQGIGAAACLSMPRVMLTESYGVKKAASKMSTLLALMAIFPILSAAFGGYIGENYGWQVNFLTLFIFGGVVFSLNYAYSPETIKNKSKRLTFRTTFLDFRYLFGQTSFLYFAGVSSIQAAFFFSMAGFMPYQFERLGASPTEFGFWFSLTSIGYIIGNIVSKRYTIWLGLERISLLGCSWCLLSIILMFLSEIPLISTPLTLASACFMFGLGNGLILANVLVLALISVDQKCVASASGFLGAMQMFCGAILGSLIVLLGGDKQFWLAVTILLILSIFSILSCYRGGLHSKILKSKN